MSIFILNDSLKLIINTSVYNLCYANNIIFLNSRVFCKEIITNMFHTGTNIVDF